jgi:hypothetical protein
VAVLHNHIRRYELQSSNSASQQHRSAFQSQRLSH